MVIIPHTLLSSEVLESLIQSYVSREGTDYGLQVFSLADKVNHVKQQLHTDEVFITFDELTESINLLTREEVEISGLCWKTVPEENDSAM